MLGPPCCQCCAGCPGPSGSSQRWAPVAASCWSDRQMNMRVPALAATLVQSCAAWSLPPSSEMTHRPQWRDVSAFESGPARAGGLHALLQRRYRSQQALQLLQVMRGLRRTALEACWQDTSCSTRPWPLASLSLQAADAVRGWGTTVMGPAAQRRAAGASSLSVLLCNADDCAAAMMKVGLTWHQHGLRHCM